jgi:hypothetical protein
MDTGHKDDADLRDSVGNDEDLFSKHPDLLDIQKKHQENEDFKAWEDEFGEGSKEDFKAWENELKASGGSTKEALGDKELEDAEEDESGSDDDDGDVDESRALQPYTASDKDYYNPGSERKGSGSLLKSARSKTLAITGILGILMAFGSIFGFLNTFRLKHLLENINFHAFNRYNASVAARSDKWNKAYLKVRMMEWEGKAGSVDGNGNAFFRANKVDTNNPFKDWYRTMRTSSFEDDMLKNQGIRFTSSIDKDGKLRPAVINIKGHEDIIINPGNGTTGVSISSLDGAGLDKVANNLDGDLKHIFEDGTGGNKAARLAIRDAVDKETHKWQVIKRRHTRKAIANMTGVRDWRFFDKTRTKIDNKKAEFQKKMINKVFPKENSRAGAFLECVLGLGGCSRSTDAANPENKTASFDPNSKAPPEAGNLVQDINPDGSLKVDASGNPIYKAADGSINKAADSAATTAASDLADVAIKDGTALTEKELDKGILEQITKKFTENFGGDTPIGKVKKVLDWLSKFNGNLKKGPNGRSKIGDAIYLARLTGSLMLAYTTVSTIADQMQSGDVDPDQLNAAMQYFDGASNSEGFNYIFNNQTFPKGMKQTRTNADGTTEQVDKCSTGEQFSKDDLVPFCDNLKPNGGSRLSGLEGAWNTFVSGSPIGSILDAYTKFKESTIGSIFTKISNAFGDVVGAVLTPVLKALGITGLISDLAAWLSSRVLTWVGVKPCMTGTEGSGAMAVNCLVGGASGAAESAARTAGGVLSFAGSTAYDYSAKLAVNYNNDTYSSMGTYDKYFAMDNQFSLASNLAFNLSLNNNPFTTLGNMFSVNKNFGKGLGGIASIFSGKALAASPNDGFRDTATFSGVDTYAIPQQCIENDPLDPNYLQNASNNSNISHDLNTLGNTDTYNTALYSKISDSSSEQDLNNITGTYNCVALDNVVRGGLGYTYGYSADNGYNSAGQNESATTNSPGSTQGGKGGALPDYAVTAPCPSDPDITPAGPGSAQRNGGTVNFTLCKVLNDVTVNTVYAKNFLGLLKDAKTAGIALTGGGGSYLPYTGALARWSDRCGSLPIDSGYQAPPCTGARIAPPGKSNHELGLAVDLNCNGGLLGGGTKTRATFNTADPCVAWVIQNSPKYGLFLQCEGTTGDNCESWHISPTGG